MGANWPSHLSHVSADLIVDPHGEKAVHCDSTGRTLHSTSSVMRTKVLLQPVEKVSCSSEVTSRQGWKGQDGVVEAAEAAALGTVLSG